MLPILRWSPQLVKLPCILVAMIGFQTATTPPHPPPSRSESVESTPLEFIIKQRTSQTTIKVICWTAALAEMTVIVLNHVHRTDLSRSILSLLVLKNDPDKIRATPLFFLGTLLTGLGGYIRYKCYKEMGTMFTFEMCIRREHRLVTSGPYGIVRHPGYTGILCAVTGVVLWSLSTGSWARESGALMTMPGQLLCWTYCILVSMICGGLISRMFKEDEALRRIFGVAWEVWAKDVPYKLIPGVY